jgi:hypothetical protein
MVHRLHGYLHSRRHEFDPALGYRVGRTSLNTPRGVAVDSAKQIVYVADLFETTILTFDSNRKRGTFGSGLVNPDGLAWQTQGYLYVTDRWGLKRIVTRGDVVELDAELSAVGVAANDARDAVYIAVNEHGVFELT